MKINITDLVQGDSSALVGKDNGRQFKSRLIKKYGDFDAIEQKDATIEFDFPESLITINSSFFLGVFADRIRKLGEAEFNKKYKFNTSDHIKEKIQDHIKKAINASSMEDILDV